MKKSLVMRLTAVVLCLVMLVTVTPFFASAGTEITEVVILNADTTPIVGERVGDHLSYETPGDANYIFTTNYWFNDSAGHSLDVDDIFEEETLYSLAWIVYPKDGYSFAKNVTVSLNGGKESIDASNTFIIETQGIIWTEQKHAAVSPLIKEINISGVNAMPATGGRVGDYLSYELADNATYTCTEHYWYNESQRVSLDSDDAFDDGNSYSLKWVFVPNEGFTFAPDMSISLNGGTENIDVASTTITENQCIVSTKPVEVETTPITDVTITNASVMPVAGERAGDCLSYVLPEDAPYTCTEHYWYNESQGVSLGQEDTFAEEDLYSLKWVFVPQKGYTFADKVTISLNGKQENIDGENITVSKKQCVVSTIPIEVIADTVTINDVTITNVDVTPIMNTKAGNFLSYGLPDDAPYTCTEHYWYNESKGAPLGQDDIFVEGDLYSLKWVFVPQNGYAFADNVNISLNDNQEDINGESTAVSEKQCVIWTEPKEALPCSLIHSIPIE